MSPAVLISAPPKSVSAYSEKVLFEWNEDKNEVNRRKHGISFATASRIFDDPRVIQYVERIEDGEERWHAIGHVAGSLLLLTVVHTWTENGTDELVRIISARRASTGERRIYDQAIH